MKRSGRPARAACISQHFKPDSHQKLELRAIRSGTPNPFLPQARTGSRAGRSLDDVIRELEQ
jgi:hypothetical protein